MPDGSSSYIVFQEGAASYWRIVWQNGRSWHEGTTEPIHGSHVGHLSVAPASTKTLLEQRAIARQNKDYKEADRLRDELAALGFKVIDRADGTTGVVPTK